MTGRPGPVLALAQQKRMALREQVTFFADEARTVPLFGFKARNVVDLAGATDVVDSSGQVIGVFRKDFRASLLRSTYHLEQPGHPVATGVERSQAMALARRFLLEWLPYHFDFTHPDGTARCRSTRGSPSAGTPYEVTVPDRASTGGWPRRWRSRSTHCRGGSTPGLVKAPRAAGEPGRGATSEQPSSGSRTAAGPNG